MHRKTMVLMIALSYSLVMFAQHSSGGGGGSSSGGGGGGGSHSGGGSSGGSSGGSYSGGHSSGGSSGGHGSGGGSTSGNGGSGVGSASHGSGGHGSSGHGSAGNGSSSGGSVPHGSTWTDGSTRFVTVAPSNGARGTEHETIQVDGKTFRQIQHMVKAGKSPEEIREFARNRMNAAPQSHSIKAERTEKRGLFSFLRHPSRKHQATVAKDLRHRVCLNGSCKVCPAGSSLGSNGACSSTVVAQTNLCMSGTYWGSGGCMELENRYLNRCYLYPDAELEAARKEMEAVRGRMEAVCSKDPASAECSNLNFQYQRAVGLYNMRLKTHPVSFTDCP